MLHVECNCHSCTQSRMPALERVSLAQGTAIRPVATQLERIEQGIARVEQGQNVLKADLDALDKRLSVIETKLCEVMEGNAARAEWMAQLARNHDAHNYSMHAGIDGLKKEMLQALNGGKSATGKRSR